MIDQYLPINFGFSCFHHIDRTHPGPNELNLPHQLALFENEDTLCVADRINARVVCYKAGLYSDNNEDTGKYLFEYIQSESRPIYGVTIEPIQKLIFALVGSTEGRDDSKVEIIDFTTQNKIDEIKNYWKTVSYIIFSLLHMTIN
ncbi:unnamed protein product [Trichobilharzia regenti]|nr:unnamed protein product [Trichobilharzia regenti]